ncbi:hypothetical protein [Prevotella pallens]|jgi:hypothetical protein|uniref:hypothetical protein n=1 Tax=Prevotella pallens TaxID=60133 RepID=UPI001CB0ECD4|nr:hypothetical protein [Prevotella pallens]MBF1517238.1 hypothetical protein [Prevotella pallens]
MKTIKKETEKEKGKRKKTGGRVKGTPNKLTALNRKAIEGVLADYNESGLFTQDFLSLEPKDRIAIAEKLIQYTTPKMQSTTVDLVAENTECTIDIMLRKLAEEK